MHQKTGLTSYQDELVIFEFPAHLTISRAEVDCGERGLQFFSEVSERKTKGNPLQEHLFLRFFPRGSPFIQLQRRLILDVQPVNDPMEFIRVGPSADVPRAVERLHAHPTAGMYGIMMVLALDTVEVDVEIAGRGLWTDHYERWMRVVKSIQPLPALKDYFQGRISIISPAAEKPSRTATKEVLPETQRLIQELPQELSFLAASILDVAQQDLLDAEDADMSLLEAAVREHLHEMPEKKHQRYLVRLFKAYDRWSKNQDRNDPALMPFAVVHGTLLAFSLYGLGEEP